MSTWSLLAFGWVNPALLGGAGLIAVPIIIHWLSRRRFRRLPWAAMRWLLEAERENRRRMRLEQWLLLALRCLALLLLALMLARPFAEPGWLGSLLGGGDRVQRIIILDDSASGQFQHGDERTFDELRAAAQRLTAWIADEAPQSPLTIYLTSSPAEPWFDDAGLSPLEAADLREQLADLDPGVAPADPQRVLTTVLARIRDSDEDRRTDLYVVSDYQQSDWADVAEGRGALTLLQELPPERLHVVLLRTAEAARSNVAITELAIDQTPVIADQPTTLRITLANFGQRSAPSQSLALTAADRPLPAIDVPALPPGGVETLTHPLTLSDDGTIVLTASRTAGDAFTLDDTRRITVNVAPALDALIVNGAPSADPRADEIYLLRRALAPPGPFASGVRIEVSDPAALAGVELSAFDVVLLCNVGFVDEAAVETLQRYVAQGGGVGLFLGDNANDLDALNQLWLTRHNLLPARLEQVVDVSTAPVGVVRTTPHPVTGMFSANADALSEYVRFRRFVRAAPVESNEPNAPTATVLARYTDDASSPALVERRLGRGRVVLVTSTVDLAWNNWPAAADGSYVVTMLELVRYLGQGAPRPASFAAGDPLALTLDLERVAPRVTFKPPNFPAQPAETRAVASSTARYATLVGPAADQLGVYQAELSPRSGPAAALPLCVNLPAAESDLTALGERALAAQLGSVPHTIARVDEAFGSERAASRRELWRWLLAAAVIVLMTEQFCAWWFGRLDRVPRRTTPIPTPSR